MQFSTEKEWIVKQKIPSTVETELPEFSKIMQQLLYNRGVVNKADAEKYFNFDLNHNPFLFPDMEKAVQVIFSAIQKGQKIAVYGDYDVDGITATALLSQVLQEYQADVWPYIPNRFDEGYGVNTEALDLLANTGVKLIITVDCGIRSPEELNYAKNLGMRVIVTDHHDPGEVLPAVDAIICQHVAALFPDKNLSGVGIAYKLAQAIFEKFPVTGKTADDYLDLAALGTVADVVPLIGENRRIVKQGIHLMRFGKRMGLSALIKAANLQIGNVTATNISFVIAPRLNAAGRLETPQLALDLLMTQDIHQAAELAQHLDDLNHDRQALTKEMQVKAEELIDPEHNLLFVANPEFNSGMVGLVAAKLTEFYYRPAVIAYQGEVYTRASCRSIQEFHITRALDECEDLLIQHGGHAMAAGFTVANENLEILKTKLQDIAKRDLQGVKLKPSIEADMVIPLEDIPANILQELDTLEPIGAENPQAVFISRNVQVTRAKAVGKDESHLKLTLKVNNTVFDAIAFHQGHWNKVLPKKIDIVYTIERNHFNGNIYRQLNIRDIKAA